MCSCGTPLFSLHLPRQRLSRERVALTVKTPTKRRDTQRSVWVGRPLANTPFIPQVRRAHPSQRPLTNNPRFPPFVSVDYPLTARRTTTPDKTMCSPPPSLQICSRGRRHRSRGHDLHGGLPQVLGDLYGFSCHGARWIGGGGRIIGGRCSCSRPAGGGSGVVGTGKRRCVPTLSKFGVSGRYGVSAIGANAGEGGGGVLCAFLCSLFSSHSRCRM